MYREKYNKEWSELFFKTGEPELTITCLKILEKIF
jgi:hypothetical protein